jgi:hypothetical protein
MKPNPILEELWKIEDAIAAEAGHDVAMTDRFLENLRRYKIVRFVPDEKRMDLPEPPEIPASWLS